MSITVVTATRYTYVNDIISLDNRYHDDQQQAMVRILDEQACVLIPLRQLAQVLFPADGDV